MTVNDSGGLPIRIAAPGNSAEARKAATPFVPPQVAWAPDLSAQDAFPVGPNGQWTAGPIQASAIQTPAGIVFADITDNPWVRRIGFGPGTRALIPYSNPWGSAVGGGEGEGYDHDNFADDHTLYVRAGLRKSGNKAELIYEMHSGISGPNRKGARVGALFVVSLGWHSGSPSSPGKMILPIARQKAETPDYDTGTFKKVVGKANVPGVLGYLDESTLAKGTVLLVVEGVDSDGHSARATAAIVM